MKYVSAPVEKVRFWLLGVIDEIRFHLMSVIFVFIIFIMFWHVPQINDLIVVINQARFHWMVVPVFFTTLSVFAFLISAVSTYFHPPRNYLAEVAETTNDDTKKTLPIWRVPKDGKEVYMEQEEKEDSRALSKVEFSESQNDYIRRIFPKILGTILILTVAFSVIIPFMRCLTNI